jgi:hypothetical protein
MSERERTGMGVDGWKEVTMVDRKPKAYTFTNTAGPQINRLPVAEPMDYINLVFNDELLNRIARETKKVSEKQNCQSSAKSKDHLEQML